MIALFWVWNNITENKHSPFEPAEASAFPSASLLERSGNPVYGAAGNASILKMNVFYLNLYIFIHRVGDPQSQAKLYIINI